MKMSFSKSPAPGESRKDGEPVSEAIHTSLFAKALNRIGISLKELSDHLLREKRGISMELVFAPPLILHFKVYNQELKKYVEFGFAFEYFPADSIGGITARQLFADGWGGNRRLDINEELWTDAEITFVAWSSDYTEYNRFLTDRQKPQG